MFRAVTVIFHHVLRALRTRARSERGVINTEYGLLMVLIAVAILVAATGLGLAIAGMLDHGATEVGRV